MKFIARFFSILFLPLLIPILSSLLIVWANPYSFGGPKSGVMFSFLYAIILCTFIMPMVGIFVLKKLNFLDDFHVAKHQEQIIPYFIIISCYSIAFYFVSNLPIPSIVKAMVFGSLVSIILTFFWNNFLKVSAHANGMGTLVGVVIGLLFISNRNVELLLVLMLILSGIVLSSRIYLKSHSVKEVGYGFLLGIITQLGAFIAFGVIGI